MRQRRTKQEKISETKSSFFEKINKIDKPLTRILKKKTERAQIDRIRNEKVTVDAREIQGSLETTINKYVPIKQTTQKKWTSSQKGTFSNTEQGRSRKYKLTNNKY